MTGGDAKLLAEYLQRERLKRINLYCAMVYATAVNEVNAAMGVICATPDPPPPEFSCDCNHLNMSRRDGSTSDNCCRLRYCHRDQASIPGAEGGSRLKWFCSGYTLLPPLKSAAALNQSTRLAIALKNLLARLRSGAPGRVPV